MLSWPALASLVPQDTLGSIIHDLGNLFALTMGQAEHLLLDESSIDPAERRECLMAIRSAALQARDLLRGIRGEATAAPPPPSSSAGGVLYALATALAAVEAPNAHISARGGHVFVDAPGSCEPAVAPMVRAVGGSLARRGDRLLIRLPLDGAESEPDARGHLAARRLLVVDDDVRVRTALASLLQTAGHEVEVASSGAEAIARYRECGFDCVVTDMEMPGLNGLAVCRAIKDYDRDAYVILLSGSDADEAAADIEAAGVDRVLIKPVTLNELLQVVSEAEARHRTGASERT